MSNIKEAFQKVGQDINVLKQEINLLKRELQEINKNLVDLGEKQVYDDQTNRQIKPTDFIFSSTHNSPLGPSNNQNLIISRGNEGVSTDRQTDRQTDKLPLEPKNNQKNSFENALEILDSLDNLKKEIRLKFKRLTDQEIIVFSTLYQLDEEIGCTDYKTLSNKLNLSESSIRDYISRLIKKGIPVEKMKINNKNIQLRISKNLKKIANLNTILKLREI